MFAYAPLVGGDKFTHLKELIVNSLVDVIINNDIYGVIFMFIRMEHQAEETVIENKIKQLKQIKPQFLALNENLCLNEVSGIMEVAANARKAKAQPSLDSIYEEEKYKADSSFLAINTEDPVSPTKEQIPSDEELKRRIETPPYQKAIDHLKEIARLYTPMQKLQCVASLNSVICQCIEDFWKNVPINKEKLSIDADQYLSILVYIVVKSQVSDLFTHITVSNEFALLGSSSSYNTYCLTTLQACFYHLLNVDIGTVLRSPKAVSSLEACAEVRASSLEIEASTKSSNNENEAAQIQMVPEQKSN